MSSLTNDGFLPFSLRFLLHHPLSLDCYHQTSLLGLPSPRETEGKRGRGEKENERTAKPLKVNVFATLQPTVSVGVSATMLEYTLKTQSLNKLNTHACTH